MDKKTIKIIVCVAVVLLGFAYYSFIYVPSQTKARCMAEAEFNLDVSKISESQARYKAINNYYEICLHRFGL